MRGEPLFYRPLVLKLLAPQLAYWKQPRNVDVTVHHERGRTNSFVSVKTKKRRDEPNYARSARANAQRGSGVNERFNSQASRLLSMVLTDPTCAAAARI